MTSGRQAVKPQPLPSSPATREAFVLESACDEYFRFFVSNAYAPFQSSGGGAGRSSAEHFWLL
jgi:hypothetical protein